MSSEPTIANPDFHHVTSTIRIENGTVKVFYLTQAALDAQEKIIKAADLRADYLQKQLVELREVQRDLVSVPFMSDLILDYLRDNPDISESEAEKNIMLDRDRNYYIIPFRLAWARLETLLRDIIPTSHGRGKRRTWALAKGV